MRILIIEDEPGIRSFIRAGLKEEGFAVAEASNEITTLGIALRNGYIIST